MRNFKESDYALNKFSEGIVYQFADGRRETIMLEDYLSANLGKSAEDFAQLKAWSDNQYHEQVIVENRTGRLDVTMNGLEETEQFATVSLDTELIHKSDGQAAMKAAKQLLDSGNLTIIQRRRFILHFFSRALHKANCQNGRCKSIIRSSCFGLRRNKVKENFQKFIIRHASPPSVFDIR